MDDIRLADVILADKYCKARFKSKEKSSRLRKFLTATCERYMVVPRPCEHYTKADIISIIILPDKSNIFHTF